jgi:glucose-6-phosphate 1-dehydrogenase
MSRSLWQKPSEWSGAKFYEATGALRDMLPNHIFQLLSLIAMGPPNSFAADAVRTEKDKVLEAMRSLDGTEVRHSTVRGQYGAGIVNDVPVKAYREEPGVEPASMTETYIAMQLNVDNWRWAGVPFFPGPGRGSPAARPRSRPPGKPHCADRRLPRLPAPLPRSTV